MGKEIRSKKTGSSAAAVTTAARKKPAARVEKPAAKKSSSTNGSHAPAISHDTIALRAYYLSEKRHKLGLPVNPHQDWLDAEKQLASEQKSKK